jgi:hypothetical protein
MLADVNRYVGIITAVVGLVVTSTSGTKKLLISRGDGSSDAGTRCAITSGGSFLSYDGMARHRASPQSGPW